MGRLCFTDSSGKKYWSDRGTYPILSDTKGYLRVGDRYFLTHNDGNANSAMPFPSNRIEVYNKYRSDVSADAQKTAHIAMTPDDGRGFYLFTPGGQLYYSKDGKAFVYGANNIPFNYITSVCYHDGYFIVNSPEGANKANMAIGRPIGANTVITPYSSAFASNDSQYAGGQCAYSFGREVDYVGPGYAAGATYGPVAGHPVLVIWNSRAATTRICVGTLWGRNCYLDDVITAYSQGTFCRPYYNHWSRKSYFPVGNIMYEVRFGDTWQRVYGSYTSKGFVPRAMAMDSATSYAVLSRTNVPTASICTYNSGSNWQLTSGISYGGPVSTGLVNGVPCHVCLRGYQDPMAYDGASSYVPSAGENYTETYTASSCNSWTAYPRSTSLAMECFDVVWGDVNDNDQNGRFVAIGASGSSAKALWSDDGQTWNACTFSATPAQILSAMVYV
jgi:hypothetical protein